MASAKQWVSDMHVEEEEGAKGAIREGPSADQSSLKLAFIVSFTHYSGSQMSSVLLYRIPDLHVLDIFLFWME